MAQRPKKEGGQQNRRTPEIREEDPSPPALDQPVRTPKVRDVRDNIQELDLEAEVEAGNLRGVTSKVDPQKIEDDLNRQGEIGRVAVSLMKADQERKREPNFLTEQDPDWVYFIRCSARDCRGPGVWIHTQPHGTLRPQDWESSYKPRQAMWPGREIYCQCCYEQKGIQQRLPLFHQDGKPHVNMRHIAKMSRAKFEKLMSQAKETVTA